MKEAEATRLLATRAMGWHMEPWGVETPDILFWVDTDGTRYLVQDRGWDDIPVWHPFWRIEHAKMVQDKLLERRGMRCQKQYDSGWSVLFFDRTSFSAGYDSDEARAICMAVLNVLGIEEGVE